MRSLFVLLGVCCLGLGPGGSASTAPRAQAVARQQMTGIVHVPPVDAPVIDPFRLPEQNWLRGNRGLEYDTDPGQTVRASAPGVVTFAGSVAGSMFVTLRHSDGLRTTVGFVQSVFVSVGDTVEQGARIATAGETMHFTVRRGDTYLDPALLFQRFRTVVRLVADPAGS